MFFLINDLGLNLLALTLTPLIMKSSRSATNPTTLSISVFDSLYQYYQNPF